MGESRENLIKELIYASEVYYQKLKEPVMTDEEYDDKINYLNFLSTQDESFSKDPRVQALLEGKVASGTVNNSEESVEHNLPMLSLKKANSKQDIKDYFDKLVESGSIGFGIQCKLDGLAIDVLYKKGKPVRMSTRGDGENGQDVSYLLQDKNLKIVGLPKKLNQLSDCIVRGELFARHSQFEEFNNERKKVDEIEFKNPRNGVVGIVTKTKKGLNYKAEITFCVYSLYIDNEYKNLNSNYLSKEKFLTINELTKEEWLKNGGQGELTAGIDFYKLMKLINEFGEIRGQFDVPTDGAVIKPVNEDKMFLNMGSTSHHPNAFIAFKYPGEKVVTTILDFDITVGKTGKLTPTAIVEPVKIDGSIVSRASCHNFNWLNEKGLRIGSKIMITKANDIIPAIDTVLDVGNGKELEIPEICPECGGELIHEGSEEGISKNIKCINPNCPSIIYYKLRTATSKQGLNVKGLSGVILKELCKQNLLKDVSDLFSLTVDNLENIVVGESAKGNDRTIGEKRAENIVNEIDLARKNTPLVKTFALLGFDGFGPAMSKLLINHFGDVLSILNASNDELTKVKGLGASRADEIVNNKDMARSIYNNLVKNGFIFNGVTITKNEKSLGSFSLSGKVPPEFKNRDEFVEYLENKGYVYDKTPNKNTTYMFGDEADSSSKIKKARQLNIKIIPMNEYKNI